MQPTILITGGGGFIGNWVVREALDRGLRVVVFDVGDRPPRWQRVLGVRAAAVPLVRGNLLDRELLGRVLDEHHVTHVIHLAALLTPACQQDPFEGARVNVLGSVALFEEVRTRAAQIRGFSYASSVAVFGGEPDHADDAPHSGNRPPTFYGAFKRALEDIAEQYWRHFQIASVGIRPQVAYGPERDVGLTAGPSMAARAAARGEAFTIRYSGRVGYDYVGDIATAFVRAAIETPRGAEVVDLPGQQATVGEIIAEIDRVVPGAKATLSVDGPLIPAHAPPKARFISALFPDWQTTSLADGIRRMVEFYRVQG
jgi:nucleoside-diphosphate-sugar epimerase